ncbi:ribonuclease P protein component [Candidatus Saccharibacteria bacterium]|nr:ribonuclease P protein component [Candidatus Saccharibacteria bacterium]
MIAQKFRFHGHASLKYVFSRGQQSRSKFFSIKWTTNPRRRNPRLAVVVSKKVFKSAVKRNRIRRRVYEIVRPFLTDTPAIDVVISVYAAEVLDASHDELTIQLLPLLHKASLKSRR